MSAIATAASDLPDPISPTMSTIAHLSSLLMRCFKVPHTISNPRDIYEKTDVEYKNINLEQVGDCRISSQSPNEVGDGNSKPDTLMPTSKEDLMDPSIMTANNHLFSRI